MKDDHGHWVIEGPDDFIGWDIIDA